MYPKEYPEWGLSSVVNTVLEFTGTGVESNTVAQLLTGGIQWVVTSRWVLESGVIQNLNGSDEYKLYNQYKISFLKYYGIVNDYERPQADTCQIILLITGGLRYLAGVSTLIIFNTSKRCGMLQYKKSA